MILFFYLIYIPRVSGQELTETTGAGFEANMISLDGAAGGFTVYWGRILSPRFTLGAKCGASSDFRAMNALEGSLFFRWNCLRRGVLAAYGLPRMTFFVQAGAGTGYYTFFDDSPRSRFLFLGEAAAGLRFYTVPFKERPLFVEPSIRFAYPSGLAVGIAFGI